MSAHVLHFVTRQRSRQGLFEGRPARLKDGTGKASAGPPIGHADIR